ncbi:MAG TPA: transglycosylase SLT domain-containing protein [Longimicrobiaceae bacterium]|nr:transglycosylase SLT domain-containing protein [Longimicrobiaceae bacterium]
MPRARTSGAGAAAVPLYLKYPRLSMKKLHPSAPAAAGLAGLIVGLALSSSRTTGEIRERASAIVALPGSEILEPIGALPRTRLVVAMEEARASLARNRPWSAWRELADHVEDPADAPASAVLLAARAASEWGGWEQVRRLLAGREWLGREGEGEGWFLLGRAHEEAERWEEAAVAYRRYAALPGAGPRGVARARLGRVLREAGWHREAAAAFGAAAERTPAARDWFRALQAEALARIPDPGVITAAAAAPGNSGPVRLRQARAEARYWTATGDTARALDRLERESRALASLGVGAEAAALVLDRARLLAAQRRTWEARDLLRTVAADTAARADDRLGAARLLGEIADTLTAEEQLARAAGFEAAGKPGLAARSIRLAIAAGAPDDPELRLRQGKLLVEEWDWDPARAVLQDAASRLTDPERAAEAELYAARVRMRRDLGDGLAALRALAERRPGTAAAGVALFLLGDATGNRAQAISYYRRAASVGRSPEAREALFRVGDRSLRAGDRAAAIHAWEEYVQRYPEGEQTALIAYRAGVLHEQAGREAAARAMYAAAMAADPVSYYAIRAGERAGADPLAGTLRERQPWVGLASDPADAAGILTRLDALEAAGLEAEWREELDAAVRRLARRPAALLALAEGVRDRGHTVEGIRLGRRLLEERGGRWDTRLLRVVFPYPYREVLEDEARDAGVDPALLAGLVRQESSFDPEARSRVGARGLAQLMPATARWLAPGAGVYAFQEPLLAVPEVNLRMGARYLRDQLRRYDGARDLALAAYNAGPSRADRWRRELGYGRDVDRFRERIPFAETREYVQLVLRNATVYRRLYGPDRSPGLIPGD